MIPIIIKLLFLSLCFQSTAAVVLATIPLRQEHSKALVDPAVIATGPEDIACLASHHDPWDIGIKLVEGGVCLLPCRVRAHLVHLVLVCNQMELLVAGGHLLDETLADRVPADHL